MTTPRLRARAILLLPAVALLASLAACAPTTSGAVSLQSPAPSAVPKAITTPAFVYGGDCASVVSLTDLATDLGTTVSLENTDPWLDLSEFVVPAVGGLRCDWDQPGGTHFQSLDLVVIPASVASASSYPAFNCASNAGPDLGDCNFNAVYSGYWFSGMVQLDENSTNAQAQAAAVVLEKQLQASAATAGPAPARVSITGAWQTPASCAALDSSGGIADALGSPDLSPMAPDASAEDGNPDGYNAALKVAGYLPCSWQDDSMPDVRSFSVYLYPGGAWAKPHLLSSGSTPVTIAGADSADLNPGSEGTQLLSVFAGTNAFVVAPDGTGITAAQLSTVASAVLKDLAS